MQIQRWRIGDCTLTSVVEDDVSRIPVQAFFPDANPQDVARHRWLVPDYADETGRIMFRLQAFLLELHGRKIIVDQCVGNAKRRELPSWNNKQTPFLDRLLAAGFATDAIDTVIHTHLHADHVGWDTQLETTPGCRPSPVRDTCTRNASWTIASEARVRSKTYTAIRLRRSWRPGSPTSWTRTPISVAA